MTSDEAWGDSEPTAQPCAIGGWSFELRGDEIADIRFDGTLLLRMIRLVARDRDWRTVPPTVSHVERRADGVALSLYLTGLGAEMVASVDVQAGAELVVQARVESRSSFERNRLGLVALHPASVAGEAFTITHSDSSTEVAEFPRKISPHQPATDIRFLAWSTDGIDASIHFEGDVFEMEDQRNWTDASFKTYSTPLDLPFPVRLQRGDSVWQAITVRAVRRSAARASIAPNVSWSESGHVMPTLQLGAATGFGPAIEAGHPVLIELELDTPGWRSALDRTPRKLDVRLVTDHPERVALGMAALAGREVLRVGVFSASTHTTTEPLWRALASIAPRLERVAGTRAHFTELNRNAPSLPADAPAITYSSTPQMHATERSQLVEAIDIQALTARDATRIARGRPLHIGPITLRPRFNAVATSTPALERDDAEPGFGAELVPGSTDARQTSRAAAAWFVASVAAFAGMGAATLTYFEVWGPRGVRSESGDLYPVGEAFEFIAALEGRALLLPDSGLPDGVHAFAARDAAGQSVAIISNLTNTRSSVAISGQTFEIEPWSWVAQPVDVPSP